MSGKPTGQAFDQMEQVAFGIGEEEDAATAASGLDGIREGDALRFQRGAGLCDVLDLQGEMPPAPVRLSAVSGVCSAAV